MKSGTICFKFNIFWFGFFSFAGKW